MGTKPQFLVDDKGEKVAVLLSIEEYQKLLEDQEELEDVQAYDEAKALGETPVPFEEAIARIERNRK
jgi:hypothetical protein